MVNKEKEKHDYGVFKNKLMHIIGMCLLVECFVIGMVTAISARRKHFNDKFMS